MNPWWWLLGVLLDAGFSVERAFLPDDIDGHDLFAIATQRRRRLDAGELWQHADGHASPRVRIRRALQAIFEQRLDARIREELEEPLQQHLAAIEDDEQSQQLREAAAMARKVDTRLARAEARKWNKMYKDAMEAKKHTRTR